MPQSFDPVFGNWYTEKQLGSGTDGKAFIIKRTNENNEVERSVLKIIRLSDNRSEGKSFNSIGSEIEERSGNVEDLNSNIKNIVDNIEIIKKYDNGKYFVKYEECETRKSTDSKSELVLIRMEEMRSLSDLLSQFSFTLGETVRLGVSVCRSLIRCRKFGYIYPNLKPENILFDRKGVCKLGDFGSFSRLEPSKTSIAYKRTQYFMAPEFIKTGKINSTVDTYSLGLILYTLINRGRLPFTEPYPQEVAVNSLDKSKENRLAGLDFPEPSIAAGDLSVIIKKACAYNVEDRYLTPNQMLIDLENVLNNKPLSSVGVEYEDIYSVSDPKMLEEKDDIESLKQDYEEEYEKNDSDDDFYEEIEKEPVSLREEIQIPDIAPIDYLSTKPKTKQKPKTKTRVRIPSTLTQIPAAKSKKPNEFFENKKLLIFIAVAIVILLLFIISLKIRFSADDPMIVSQQAAVITAQFERLILYGI